MSRLGIYFGPKQLSLVQSEGKKLVTNVNIPLSSLLDSGMGTEKVPEHVKIATVLKDELRKNAIDVGSVDIVLPGKDLIIRTFHMPMLSPDELSNAVRFEAKKYIPFKVEDLVSDFQIKNDKASRKNFVLFVGIKKENLDRYLSVFTELDIKPSSVEYSGFGILRLLKLSKTKEKGVVALVNIDLAEEDEVNFIVLENGFPLFSRDITLGGESPLGGPGSPQPELTERLEKLKVELRISLDFYLRKFPTKNIQSVIFMAPEDFRLELETFIKERGLIAKFIDCKKLFDKPVEFSSGFLKAYACSISKMVKGPLSVDLLPGKAKKAGSAFSSLASLPILQQVKIDFRAVVLGACIIGLPYLANYYLRQPIQQRLDATKGSRPAVSAHVRPDLDVDSLQAMDAGYREKIKVIKNLLQGRRLLTPTLDTIPRAAGKGLWLSSISFQPDGKALVLTLSGSVYLGDSTKEMEAVNKFISDLKNMPEFNKSFGNISLVSMDQGQSESTLVTNFRIACRSL
jgi:hypothetical protein